MLNRKHLLAAAAALSLALPGMALLLKVAPWREEPHG